ncbi:TetR/AcrR family transcriptional regulator C-terminal domain-containing protein [Eubacterium multiforme]|uniref:Dihydroxyacetone kinase regulator n=1 Tax=Eubacterium multiforme TaxID=83339 RepID=A0ABT9UPV9_9FIRM|nr:TetR/AcrR family transcriptional regulator C-terminal domain-containing protein [Eubacterium multiforme]MDQ0148337.1 putative dihydroxyacetone kinase regulator [Eubacterium multiforme]
MKNSVLSKMTKELFASALKKYMRKKPINKITIQEISNECGLNRRTFYRHFKDIYDLLEWSYQTEIENKINTYIDFPHWSMGLLDLFDYFYTNKEISHSIIKFSNKQYLNVFLYNEIYKMIIPVIDQEGSLFSLTESKKKFLCNFYALSFTATLIQWIENGMNENPNDIVENISLILKGSISRITKQN